MIEKPLGVIDIGSNSVRLVLFACRRCEKSGDGIIRSIFNEKASCALGAMLRKTGFLEEKGKQKTLTALKRFKGILQIYGVEKYSVIATAAIREAIDGQSFVQQIQQETGFSVQILSGMEEAIASARGVLYAQPAALGVIGDMGGSSLEMALVRDGEVFDPITLPIGILQSSQNGVSVNNDVSEKQQQYIEKQLRVLPKSFQQQQVFYAVGGSWRALATYIQENTAYPVQHPHLFAISVQTLQEILKLLQTAPVKQLRKVSTISKGRAVALPYAAAILKAIVQSLQVQHIVFSACGLREGYVLQQLLECPPVTAALEDAPLAAEIESYAAAIGCIDEYWPVLWEWSKPAFQQENAEYKHLLKAAFLLVDIAKLEHRDHRAALTLQRLLYVPVARITHQERAILALILYTRYGGSIEEKWAEEIIKILSPEDIRFARKTGAVLRLAKALSGGCSAFLTQTTLQQTEQGFVLHYAENSLLQEGEIVNRRLQNLNKF